jgi:saccharopine dehydrogenase (NAD+, L-lysine-forming)
LPLIQKSGIKVIGDISCDINGSIEITKEGTMPDKACYTYDAENDSFVDGIKDNGITVMAIDNLPCEFAREASSSFSGELKSFVSDIIAADFREDYNEIKLPHEIKKAIILYNGRLTEEYEYMNQFL